MNRTTLALSPLAAFFLHASGQTPRKDLPLPVPFRLTSDGHACSGYFSVQPKRLVWKSAFSTCRAAWTAHKDGDLWILHLDTTSSEARSCRMHFVRMRPMTPIEKYSIWEIAGFQSLAEARDLKSQPELDCGMQ